MRKEWKPCRRRAGWCRPARIHLQLRPGRQCACRAERKQPAQHCSRYNQQAAFRHQLTQQRAALSSESHAQAEVALPRRVAGHNQHDHVAARDQQDKDNQRHQYRDWLAVVIAQAFSAFCRRKCELHLRMLRVGRAETRVSSRLESQSGFGHGLLRSHARRKARDQSQTPPVRRGVDRLVRRVAPRVQLRAAL